MNYNQGYITAKVREWILFFLGVTVLTVVLFSSAYWAYLNRNKPDSDSISFGPITSLDSVVLNGKLGRLQGYKNEYTFSTYDSSDHQEVIKTTEQSYKMIAGNTLMFRERTTYSVQKNTNAKLLRYKYLDSSGYIIGKAWETISESGRFDSLIKFKPILGTVFRTNKGEAIVK